MALVKDFKHQPGVISQAAHHGKVELHVVFQPAGLQLGQHSIVTRGAAGRGIGNEIHQILALHAEGIQLLLAVLGAVALKLINDGQEIRHTFLGHPVIGGVLEPHLAVGDAHHEVIGREAELAHAVDGQGNQFRIGTLAGFAQDIGIELHELTQAAFLRLFVAETGADFKPLERLGVFALVSSGNAPQRGGELRAHGDIALALVLEAEKLGGQLAAGFLEVELGGFDRGGFPFHKAVTVRHTPPRVEQIVAEGAFLRGKIAESGQRLEACVRHSVVIWGENSLRATLYAISPAWQEQRDCSVQNAERKVRSRFSPFRFLCALRSEFLTFKIKISTFKIIYRLTGF